MREFRRTREKGGAAHLAAGPRQEQRPRLLNWLYLGNIPDLPETRASLENACDMRLVSSLANEHLDYIADTVMAAVDQASQAPCVAGALR